MTRQQKLSGSAGNSCGATTTADSAADRAGMGVSGGPAKEWKPPGGSRMAAGGKWVCIGMGRHHTACMHSVQHCASCCMACIPHRGMFTCDAALQQPGLCGRVRQEVQPQAPCLAAVICRTAEGLPAMQHQRLHNPWPAAAEADQELLLAVRWHHACLRCDAEQTCGADTVSVCRAVEGAASLCVAGLSLLQGLQQAGWPARWQEGVVAGHMWLI